MSMEAITWALKQKIDSSSQKFLLMILANYANEDCLTYPGIPLLCRSTSQNRKTIISNLSKLEENGFIKPTGALVGKTNSIKVYKICCTNESEPETVHLKQSQIVIEAVPNFQVSSPKLSSPLTTPIKKEPLLNPIEPNIYNPPSLKNISNKPKKYSLVLWEEMRGKKLTVDDFKDWAKKNRVSRDILEPLVEHFIEKVTAGGNKYSDFESAFKVWIREDNWLKMNLKQAQEASIKKQDVTFYNKI